MPTTLATAREEFIRHMYRDNLVAERPRLLAVLDAVIAWSAAHPDLVRFRPDENTKGVIRFEDVQFGQCLLGRDATAPQLSGIAAPSRFVAAVDG